MRHKHVWFGWAILLAVGMVVGAQAAAPEGSQGIAITVNGQLQHFDTPPLVVDGHVLVPLRGVFQTLGASVAWIGDTGVVTVSNGKKIRLQIGSREALIGERSVLMEVAPRLHENRAYIPLRFVSESLGAHVAWNPTARTIAISSAKPSVAGFSSQPRATAPAAPSSPLDQAPAVAPPSAPEKSEGASPETPSSDDDDAHQWNV